MMCETLARTLSRSKYECMHEARIAISLAKILATNSGDLLCMGYQNYHGLPKLVANIGSQFQHLVNNLTVLLSNRYQ